MPLLQTAMYEQGIELCCVPTADNRDTWLASMQHIALEGCCFVLPANQFARRTDYAVDYPASIPNELRSSTGAAVLWWVSWGNCWPGP